MRVGSRERIFGVRCRLVRGVRWRPCQDKWDDVPLADFEVGDRAEVLPAHRNGRLDLNAIGAAYRLDTPLDLPHPRDDAPVAKAQNEVHVHLDRAALAAYDADERGGVFAWAHEILDDNGAALR